MEYIKILCSSSNCAFRSGDGYYGTCKHPVSNQLVPYNGVTRLYAECCDLLEHRKLDERRKR